MQQTRTRSVTASYWTAAKTSAAPQQMPMVPLFDMVAHAARSAADEDVQPGLIRWLRARVGGVPRGVRQKRSLLAWR